jgi:hypothetical protein
MDDLDTLLRDYFSSEPIDAGARARLQAFVVSPPRAMNRLAVAAAVAGAVVLAVVLSVVLARHSSDRAPLGGASTPTIASPSIASPTVTSPTGHGSLTDHEFAVAVDIARREADRTARSITSATATVGQGTVTDSNTGHKCASGTVLHIKLIGEFNVGIAGAVLPGNTAAPQDITVHAMLITADPESGEECLISVQVGNVTPDPGATVLFTH